MCAFSSTGEVLAGDQAAAPPCAVKRIRAVRCDANPLVTPASSKSIGGNINGPSVIRAPAWVEKPLGRYYMYFAHHGGRHIRVAYADKLTGPWTVHEPGSLTLEQAAGVIRGHIASPDVHVDNETKTVRMYFHGPSRGRGGQITGVAHSKDGLRFEASAAVLGPFYFRVFEWRGAWYAVAKSGNEGGLLLRSKRPITPFEARKKQLIRNMRHAAVMVRGDLLLVFYSRGGDSPERILLSTVKLTDDWAMWQASQPIDVLKPEKDYEGTRYELKPSRWGSATRVRQLRDPCIFEEDGKVYLFYSVAGESGIAMAELTLEF